MSGDTRASVRPAPRRTVRAEADGQLAREDVEELAVAAADVHVRALGAWAEP